MRQDHEDLVDAMSEKIKKDVWEEEDVKFIHAMMWDVYEGVLPVEDEVEL